jgi:glutaredoxin-like protein NrdH
MEQCKLYALSTCGHCKACKKLLSDCGVHYEFTDVDLLTESERQSVIEEIRELPSRWAFPTIVIGDRFIVGYKENEIKEALGVT